MQPQAKTIIDLERKFWQSMVDNEPDIALGMLAEPSLMVSSHGAMSFDHQKYRQMAEQGKMVLRSYELSDMQVVFPNATTAIATYRVKQTVAQRGKETGRDVQEMNDTSTWIKADGAWKCAIHTETPAKGERKTN